ncbi:MAG TPA: DUF3592 domain-containing protein [Bryobacteraceae bacterium]|nr:DUF3592 domain-containing protein [Bryobacteraceae bacterium]
MEWVGALISLITLIATFRQARAMILAGLVMNDSPRVRRVAYWCRIYFAIIGGLIVLGGLWLASRKAVRIYSWASSNGVITAVQVSHHTIAPYSFYVTFKARDGDYEHFAYTSSPIRYQEGDRVTVIYDPAHPDAPELLMLDSDWMGFAMICLAGFGVVGLGFWLVHKPRA